MSFSETTNYDTKLGFLVSPNQVPSSNAGQEQARYVNPRPVTGSLSGVIFMIARLHLDVFGFSINISFLSVRCLFPFLDPLRESSGTQFSLFPSQLSRKKKQKSK